MTLPESPFRQVTRNVAALFIAQFAIKLIGFLTGLLLANYLDVGQFGIYGFAIAFSSLFIPLCDIGIDTYVVREIAAKPVRRVEFTGTAIVSKALFSLLAFLVIAGAILLTSYDRENLRYVLLGAAITVVRTFPATFVAFFRGAQRMEFDAASTVVGKVIEIIALLAGIAAGFSLEQLLLLLLASSILQTILTGILAARNGFLASMRFTPAAWSHLLRGGMLFALTGISVNLYFQIDSVLLSFLVGEEAVGLYRSAYNLVFAMQGFSAAVVVALFPMIAQSHGADPTRSIHATRSAISYSLMFALPVAAAGTVFAEGIMTLLYKDSFLTAATTLQIVVWWLPVMFVTNIYGHVLGAINLQKIVLLVSGINAVFNVALNLSLIPVFHENGAAAATVLTELLGLALLSGFVKRRYGLVFDFPSIGKIFAAAAVFPLTSVLLPAGSLAVLAAISASAYVALLFLFGLVSFSDLRSLISHITGQR